jgi:hypothetical protein
LPGVRIFKGYVIAIKLMGFFEHHKGDDWKWATFHRDVARAGAATPTALAKEGKPGAVGLAAEIKNHYHYRRGYNPALMDLEALNTLFSKHPYSKYQNDPDLNKLLHALSALENQDIDMEEPGGGAGTSASGAAAAGECFLHLVTQPLTWLRLSMML